MLIAMPLAISGAMLPRAGIETRACRLEDIQARLAGTATGTWPKA